MNAQNQFLEVFIRQKCKYPIRINFKTFLCGAFVCLLAFILPLFLSPVEKSFFLVFSIIFYIIGGSIILYFFILFLRMKYYILFPEKHPTARKFNSFALSEEILAEINKNFTQSNGILATALNGYVLEDLIVTQDNYYPTGDILSIQFGEWKISKRLEWVLLRVYPIHLCLRNGKIITLYFANKIEAKKTTVSLINSLLLSPL